MPLNLDDGSEGSGGGQFYDKLRFKATGGNWWMKDGDGEKRFPTGFTCVFDMDSLQTGWSRFNGSYPVFEPDPSLSESAPMPPPDPIDPDKKWKRAFKLLVFSNDHFGGTVEFMHDAGTVTRAFSALYSAYEAQKDGGKVPVIEVDGNPTKAGDYYAPNWKIAKMADRPTSLPEAGAPAKAPAEAPAKAPAAAPAKAPAAAPASASDEF